MQAPFFPVVKDIVLVGGGHTHVGALRAFGMRPIPGVRLTVIATDTHTPYSGMLPGYIAGLYTHDEVHLDLRRLCAFAGARYFQSEVTGLDRDGQRVLCDNRPPVPYDVLSINTGSTPQLAQVPGAAGVVWPVKPIRQFDAHWHQLLAQVQISDAPVRVAVVGAGAGGIEMLLAMQQRLSAEWRQRHASPPAVHMTLVGAEPTLLPTHNRHVQASFARRLARLGVAVHLGQRVRAVHQHSFGAGQRDVQAPNGQVVGPVPGRVCSLELSTETLGPFDAVVWATQAGGPAWLASTGLALSEAGFVRVRPTLQTVTDERVFAAGDVAHWDAQPLEKAGVFAVRMGMPLADNLRRAVLGQPLKPYTPQRRWLALLGTGQQQAVASRGWLYAEGAWVWRWKDRIDRDFMGRFGVNLPLPTAGQTVHEPNGATLTGVLSAGWRMWRMRWAQRSSPALALSPAEQAELTQTLAMRCGGCGAKVGPSVLGAVLRDLPLAPNPDVLLGLNSPDDAAVVRVPPGHVTVQTVDFFRAMTDDPYLLGGIAAVHALGDVYAMGARPHTCMAVVTVPPGLRAKVQDTLFQLMSGAAQVLADAGCTLVGGHTGEGQELGLGFSVQGLLPTDQAGEPQSPWQKGGLQDGQVLILTKPIGTGVIMAAAPTGQAKGCWVDGALAAMQQSNAAAVPILQAHGATACTDVTGFGLLGHALEMARASGVQIELNAHAIPLLDGALALSQQGVTSSLYAANEQLAIALQNPDEARQHSVYPLLMDPQTAGGLLVGVPAERAAACVQALQGAGYGQAGVVGQVQTWPVGQLPSVNAACITFLSGDAGPTSP